MEYTTETVLRVFLGDFSLSTRRATASNDAQHPAPSYQTATKHVRTPIAINYTFPNNHQSPFHQVRLMNKRK